MINPYLIGHAVYLRPLERPDAAAIVPWFNDPDVNHFLERVAPMTLHQEEQWIADAYDGAHNLALGIALREDDRLVGVVGLKDIDSRNRSAGFGISIGVKELWGRGHGTEATRLIVKHCFETLNLNRVWLHVFEYNQRGLKAYEKVGFRREGVLRQSAFRDGRYWDTVVMGLLRQDWELTQSAVP